MKKLGVFLGLAALPLIVTAGWTADWTQWRGPNGNGIAPDTGINKNWGQKAPQTLWTVPMGDQGFAGPSVADGKVFIVDHQGEQDIVKALDFQTGQEIWRYAYKDTAQANYGYARCSPTINDGKVYTLSRLGVVDCLEENTGKLVWTHNLLTEFGGWRLAYVFHVGGHRRE